MAFDAVTKPGKIGLLLLVIGTVFFLVGFSVPYWLRFSDHFGRDTFYGLWMACNSQGNCGSLQLRDLPEWYQGTQAAACLALIALIVDYVILILFLCGKPKVYLLGILSLTVIATVLAFVAAVVFGSEAKEYYRHQLHWGFAFDIIGAIFLAGASIFLFVEYCRRR